MTSPSSSGTSLWLAAIRGARFKAYELHASGAIDRSQVDSMLRIEFVADNFDMCLKAYVEGLFSGQIAPPEVR